MQRPITIEYSTLVQIMAAVSLVTRVQDTALIAQKRRELAHLLAQAGLDPERTMADIAMAM